MIYTLGFTEYYLNRYCDAIIKKKVFVKRGAKPYYHGGSVWQHQHQVHEYIENNLPRLDGYAVFGVVAEWITSTIPTMDRDNLLM